MAVKHIALINMSAISGKWQVYYAKEKINDSMFKAWACQTNETALQYFCWKLAMKETPEVIDKVFAFETAFAKTKKGKNDKNKLQEAFLNMMYSNGEFKGLLDGAWISVDKDGCNEKTSTDWLKQSIPAYQEYLKEKLKSQQKEIIYKSFDDWVHIEYLSESDTLESLANLNNMITAIQTYRDDNIEDEIVVHIDLTGGQRYSTVMMMALIQLSKYSGIQIGDVVYSNMDNGEINDVKSLVDMYSLISGAEEFTTFGSVKQIEALFVGKKTSKQLTELIVAMKNVSEVFKVCGNKDSVNKVLKELKDKIEDYKVFLKNNKSTDENGNSVDKIKLDGQEQFFSNLLPTIEREYSMIFKDDAIDAVKIIKWCLDRGLLQQALTLYSEWLPAHIINMPSGLEYKKLEKELNNEKTVDWMSNEQFLFKGYTPSNYERKNYVGLINTSRDFKNFLRSIKWEDNEISKLKNELSKEASFYRGINTLVGHDNCIKLLDEIIKFSSKCRIYGYHLSIGEDTLFGKLRKKRADVQSDIQYKWKDVFDERRRLNVRNFIGYILETEDDILCDILNLSKKYSTSIYRIQVLSYLFIKGDINVVGDDLESSAKIERRKKIINIIWYYNEIVSEWRNSLNHANAQSDGSNFSDIIAQKITDSLDVIDELMGE